MIGWRYRERVSIRSGEREEGASTGQAPRKEINLSIGRDNKVCSPPLRNRIETSHWRSNYAIWSSWSWEMTLDLWTFINAGGGARSFGDNNSTLEKDIEMRPCLHSFCTFHLLLLISILVLAHFLRRRPTTKIRRPSVALCSIRWAFWWIRIISEWRKLCFSLKQF